MNKKMARKIKSDRSVCFLEIKGVCRKCKYIVGDCIIKTEEGDKNLGYHKFQSSVIDITQKEIALLPKLACKSCQKKFWEGLSKTKANPQNAVL
jgi:hypothetical protein